jgi:peptidyl-prolyl cis-trans isomerase SurA
VFEDAVFGLKPGQYSDPIRTKQGYIIFKVDAHNPGGVPAFKDVQEDVEQSYYESRMMPAMRDYLTEMREEAYIELKPGYTDTGASPKEIKPVYSAYTPPTTKKKKKVERTRFRETTHSFRQTSAEPAASAVTPTATKKNASATVEKPGKKEKIRYGQAPSKTLPSAPSTAIEDAGATAPSANATASAAAEPENPLEAGAKQAPKTRYSARAKTEKKAKSSGPSIDPRAAPAPDAAEVADKQQQAAPLGLGGDTSNNKKKKKTATTTGDKTRLTDEKKKPADATPDSSTTPVPPAAPAPTTPQQ